MTETILLIAIVVVLLAIVITLQLRRLSDRDRSLSGASPDESRLEKLRQSLSNALSDAVFSEDLDKCIASIASGIRSAFGGDAFVFRRKPDAIDLVAFSVEDATQTRDLLRRVGLKLDPHAIPISEGRDRIFNSPYTELEDPFQLVGDMTTTAACRKIQRDLKFKWIVTAATKMESERLALVLLSREKTSQTRNEFLQFSDILKSAVYISSLKKKLDELESTSQRELPQEKNEMQRETMSQLLHFDEIPIPVALLDEKGIVIELNAALKQSVGSGTEIAGGDLASILDEAASANLSGILNAIPSGNIPPIPVFITAGHFNLHIVPRKNSDQGQMRWVAFFIESADNSDKIRELEGTVDSLKTEVGLAQRLAAEGSKHTEDIVRNASVPMLAVSGNQIQFISEKCESVFNVHQGQTFDDFLSVNGITSFKGTEPVFEVTDAHDRTFLVAQWNTLPYHFCTFTDVSDHKKLQDDLAKAQSERGKLFNGLLPTVTVKDDKLLDWNDAFASLFKDFLFAGSNNNASNTLDSFLNYLGETPDDFKLELRSSGFVMRTCHPAGSSKWLDVNAVMTEDSAFLFVKDKSDTENAKLALHEAQEVLTGLIDSFHNEPVIIVRGGVVWFASPAASDHLPISARQSFIDSEIFHSVGIKNFDEAFTLNGKTYRVEKVEHGDLAVYRFGAITGQVAPRTEARGLEPRHKISSQLVLSYGYEDILRSLLEIVKTRVADYTTRILSVGIVQELRETSEVHCLTVSSGDTESSPVVSFSSGDSIVLKDEGVVLHDRIAPTAFMKKISAGDPTLVVQSSTAGNIAGFASAAIVETGFSQQDQNELADVLKIASSVAVNIHLRTSAERKFAESGRVTRAVVGLSGIELGPFSEVLKRTIDLLKQVLGCDSTGAYTMSGTSMTSMSINGDLPNTISAHGARFGSFVPVSELGSEQLKTINGLYFGMKSRSGKLGLMFRFLDAPPAAAEIGAIASIALDLLETHMAAESQAKVAAKASDDFKSMSQFITGLASAASAEEVAGVLEKSLSNRGKGPAVTLQPVEESRGGDVSAGIVQEEIGDRVVYRMNLRAFGIGVLNVECEKDEFARTMMSLAVDRILSLQASRELPVRKESTGLSMKALLVEPDGKLLEEESRVLLKVFEYVKSVVNAAEAARTLESEEFAAAFVDLELPSVNGRELCAHVKKNFPKCTTVLISNHENEQVSGGVDYVAMRPLEEENIKKLVPK